MMCGTAENRVLEWRGTAAVCQNGGKKRVLDVHARLFDGFSGTVHRICWNYLEIEMEVLYYGT